MFLGLADIPTGKTSPYIMRRTTMATRTSPRLAAQKLTQSLLNIHKENHAGTSQPRVAGSRSQKVTPESKYLQLDVRKWQGSLGEGFTPSPLTWELLQVCPSSPWGTEKSVVSSPEDAHSTILLQPGPSPAGPSDSEMGSGLVR